MLVALYDISAYAFIKGCIVTKPSIVDFKRMHVIGETALQVIVNRLWLRASPENTGLAVSKAYRLEIEQNAACPKAVLVLVHDR